MYAFAQRSDTRVFDEPLYAHYLAHSDARAYHPGADEILGSQDNEGRRVIENILLGPSTRPVLFFKNMAHHLVELEWDFLGQLNNLILTREPRDMILSYAKTIPEFDIGDLGYRQLTKLADTIEALGQKPRVLDSRSLLQNPERILRKLCLELELPFDPAMLTWNAGPRVEDGIWAKHWYQAIHRSTGFQPYSSKADEPFPEKLKPLLARCQEQYDLLIPFLLK